MEDFANIAGGNVIVGTLAKVRFSASSSAPNHAPSDAVLNGSKCWCSVRDPTGETWLQIDLGRVLAVHGFETQGHNSEGVEGWCTSYRFDSSINGQQWKNEGLFNGNKGTQDVANNKLKDGEINARYVRFYPKKCGGSGDCKLRVEIFWTEPVNYVSPGEAKEAKEAQEVQEAKEAQAKREAEKKLKEIEDLGIPDLPPIVVTLSTELVRLRGGPYWSESYARLLPTRRASNNDSSLPSTVCVVDHLTDGGRWILLGSWQSDQQESQAPVVPGGLSRWEELHTSSLPRRTVGWARNLFTPSGYSISVNSFGKILGADFNGLRKKYKQTTVVDEVRVFGCSLASQQIVHFKTDDEEMCVRVMTDVLGLCRSAAGGTNKAGGGGGCCCFSSLKLPGKYELLPGHERFGNGKFQHHCQPTHGCLCSPLFNSMARCTRCCATSGIPMFGKDVRIGLVWVRMRDGIVKTTDPNDPSFLLGSDGEELAENPISGGGGGGGENMLSNFMASSLEKSAMKAKKEGSESWKKNLKRELNKQHGSLDIVRQDTYDEGAIEMMVRPKDLATELQSHELAQLAKQYQVSSVDVPCFHCEGTGKRWVAVKNVYGEIAGAAAKSDWEERQQSIGSNGSKEGKKSDNIDGGEEEAGGGGGTTTTTRKEKPVRVAQVVPAENVAAYYPTRDGSFFEEGGDESKGDKVMTRAADYVNITHPSLDRCWVCRGTGKAEGTLPAMMDRVGMQGGETKGETKGGEGEEEGEEVEEEVCEICWCDPPKFGISTSCTHFFCEECLQGHLKQVQMSGEFPGFCPMCQASVPSGEEPVYGRIDGKAMTFLERHGVIEREFQFQFMKKQNGDEKLFFSCPAKCGNYLVDVDPKYVLRDHAVAVKTERCPCGIGVCVQCHQLVEENEFYTHRCPESKVDHAVDDAATIATMKKLGKKCPNCDMFIIKNAGCDIMMCGDKAHGDLRRAIKQGGCGQCFKWSDLTKIEDNITNFQGQRVKCNAPVKYAKEIVKEKKRLGITMTENEIKISELNLDTLEVEKKGADNDAFPAVHPNAPVNMARLALNDAKHNQLIVHAIRDRDPHAILQLVVDAYNMQPKRRIEAESRLWRSVLDLHEGPPWGKPGDFFVAIYILPTMPFVIGWSIVKSVLKIILGPFLIPFSHPSCHHGRRVLNLCHCYKCRPHQLHRTTMVVYTFVMPFILSGCIVIWSNVEGPVILLSAFVFVNALIFSLIVAHFDNSHVYNSPLTQACVHGQPDILRVLLQHGADPNHPSDSMMTPMLAAYVHGNWECVNILESLHDQNLGHYKTQEIKKINNDDDIGQNWLTRFRLNRTQSIALDKDRTYWCTPFMCSLCFCRVRPSPLNEIERQRRARPEHTHNRNIYQRVDGRIGVQKNLTKNWCRFWLFMNVIILIIVSIDWSNKGYMWRYIIANFDWDIPGNYFCADPLPNNGTRWRTFQHTRVGAAGVFATFSDIKLQKFNVDFDFRHVGREENYSYTNPHPATVEFDAAVQPRARYCPAAKEEEVRDGGVACVSNCMPCDKIIGPGAESCKKNNIIMGKKWLVDFGKNYCSEGEGADESSFWQLCDECQGDCDADSDCKESLYCFKRGTSSTLVPGCRAGGDGDVPSHDYCSSPSMLPPPVSESENDRTLMLVDSGDDYCSKDREQLCVACQGDCDADADCKDSLVCFQRETSSSLVPGCKAGGDGDVETHDYCYDPSPPSTPSLLKAVKSDFDPEEYCNVAIKNDACDSPYFLRGVYPSPPTGYPSTVGTRHDNMSVDSQTEKLWVNKLLIEIQGGSCGSEKSSIEFGVNAVLGADSYNPMTGYPAMRCLGFYFGQPSFTTPLISSLLFNSSRNSSTTFIRTFTNIGEGGCRYSPGGSNAYTILGGPFDGESLVECRVRCEKDNDCRAFASHSALGRCYLYSGGVYDRTHLTDTNNDGYACYVLDPTDMTSSSSSSSSSSSLRRLRRLGSANTYECTEWPSPDGTQEERCNFGNTKKDGYEYLYNTGRDGDTPGACGIGGCWCCRRAGTQKLSPFELESVLLNGGCGWINFTKLTSVVTQGNLLVVPSHLYTGKHGWMLTNKRLESMVVDPGPGVVYASSYYDVDTPSIRPFDYCNGVKLQDKLLSDDVAETLTLSYKKEQLRKIIGYDAFSPGEYACAVNTTASSPTAWTYFYSNRVGRRYNFARFTDPFVIRTAAGLYDDKQWVSFDERNIKQQQPDSSDTWDDVSTNQPARSSSSHSSDGGTGAANDGNFARNHANEWHTSDDDDDADNWWGVQLSQPSSDFRITFYARDCCNGNNMGGKAAIWMANDWPDHNTKWSDWAKRSDAVHCNDFAVVDSGTTTIQCLDLTSSYSYIFVRPASSGRSSLMIPEITVMVQRKSSTSLELPTASQQHTYNTCNIDGDVYCIKNCLPCDGALEIDDQACTLGTKMDVGKCIVPFWQVSDVNNLLSSIWQVAAIIDGTKDTWDYDESWWTDSQYFDDGNEKKTTAFFAVSNTIRVKFEKMDGSCIEEFTYEHKLGRSLQSIFSGPERLNVSPGRATWLRLGCDTFATQSECNRHGFNLRVPLMDLTRETAKNNYIFETGFNKIRFGLMMNQENNCDTSDTTDTYVGVGLQVQGTSQEPSTGGWAHAGGKPVRATIFIKHDAGGGRSSSKEMLVDKGDSGCHTASPCGRCQGDCDNDGDCSGSLKCFERDSSSSLIPGCKQGGSGDKRLYDYCYSSESSPRSSEYILHRSGAKCTSAHTDLGYFKSVEECANACRDRSGCQFFNFDEDSGIFYEANCHVQWTATESCSESFDESESSGGSKYDFYELEQIGGELLREAPVAREGVRVCVNATTMKQHTSVSETFLNLIPLSNTPSSMLLNHSRTNHVLLAYGRKPWIKFIVGTSLKSVCATANDICVNGVKEISKEMCCGGQSSSNEWCSLLKVSDSDFKAGIWMDVSTVLPGCQKIDFLRVSNGYQVEIASELNGLGLITRHDFMRDGNRIDLFQAGTRTEVKSVRVTLSSPNKPSQWDLRHRTATRFRLELTTTGMTKSVSFGIMPYDCDRAPNNQVYNQVWSPAFDCLRKFFSTYNVSSTTAREGCGWTDLRQFQNDNTGTIPSKSWNVAPSFLYTDAMGWMLTEEKNGKVFASSWGDPLSSLGGDPLTPSGVNVDVDYADGVALGSSEYNAVWSFQAAFVNCEI